MANKVRQSVSAKMRSIQNKSTVDVNLKSSEAAIPTDQQARLSQTIQTHNAVSIPLNTVANGTYFDCDGFDRLAVTFVNDASTTSAAFIHWSNDGVNTHGVETIVASATLTQKAGVLEIKGRYARVQLQNSDGALAHTMSAWAYLKV